MGPHVDLLRGVARGIAGSWQDGSRAGMPSSVAAGFDSPGARGLNRDGSASAHAGEETRVESPATTVCRLSVNGDRRECAATPFTTLLEALRYGLGLPGSKQGCDKGDCAA